MADPSTKIPAQPSYEIGSSGLRRAMGYIQEEYLPELAHRQGLEVYRRMQSDPVVGGLLYGIECLIRQVPWTVNAVDESPAAAEAQAFVESLKDDMSHSWSDMMGEIATMLTYGFAPMELVVKQRRGWQQNDPRYHSLHDDFRYGVRKLALRAQHTVESWNFDEFGEPSGFVQYRYYDGLTPVTVPLDRVLLFRTKAISNNPQGHSILRSAYAPWWRRTRIEEIEAIGIERDLAGLPVYMAPSDVIGAATPAGTKALQDAQRLVSSVKRNAQEGIVIPSDRDEKGNLFYEFKLLSSGGTRAIDIQGSIRRYDTLILQSCLADFMLLGSGATGSWALSRDKTELFSIALNVFLNSIADTLNRGLLPKLWALNGMDPLVMPKWVPGQIEPPDLGALGSYITALTTAGVTLFPDDRLEDHLRGLADMPPIPDDRDERQAEAAQAAMELQQTVMGGTPPAEDDTAPPAEEKPAPAKPRLVAKLADPEPEQAPPEQAPVAKFDMDTIMSALTERLARG
jgi:hypothetical protein